AVVIKIRQHHPPAFRLGFADSGGLAHVGERAVVIVVVQLGLLALVVSWMTVRSVTGAMFAAVKIILGRPFDVIGDDEVEPAVFVVIEPACAGGPSALVGHACLGGDIGECAVAIVVIQDGAA